MECQTSAVAAPLRHSQVAGSKAKQAFPQWLVVTRYNLVNDGRGIVESVRDSPQDLCCRSRGIELRTRWGISCPALTALVVGWEG